MNIGTLGRGAVLRRRAVVTGGAGFIGSHLVDRLVADGWAILVIDDLSTGHQENLPIDVRLERLDVARADLEPVFRRWRPTVVFHLAAQASVPLSLLDPVRDLEVNVIGTYRVTAAARDAGARRVVFASSGGAIYGEGRRPATERSLPAPTSYYGVHKLAAEGQVRLGGTAYAIVRPSNVYGPRQQADLEGAVVAAFVDQARTNGVLQIHGDGAQTRDFVHVRDVVAAFCLLADPATPIGIWNVASGKSTSIADLAVVVERALRRPVERQFGQARPGDVRRSAMSAAQLRLLNWQPTTNLRTGIRELIRRSP